MSLAAVQAPTDSARPAANGADEELQDRLLPGVSRTFALTIPKLPEALRGVVTNGYLLCRIADTIEDEPALDAEERRAFHTRFTAAVAGHGDPEAFAAGLAARLSAATLPAEHALVRDTPAVLRVTAAYPARQRQALLRCVQVMCEGMPRWAERGRVQPGRPRGLADLAELRDYCYVVAGVVGEMLTELFCSHAPDIDAQRAELQARSVAFGQGLQMTNILKDVWEDLDRGYCWLPRAVFAAHGCELDALRRGDPRPGFEAGLGELLGVAHGCLREALEFTLCIPPAHAGIRRFCLEALGMAVLTLRRIERRRGFQAAAEIKITRRRVRSTVRLAGLLARRDRALRLMFRAFAARLPAPPG